MNQDVQVDVTYFNEINYLFMLLPNFDFKNQLHRLRHIFKNVETITENFSVEFIREIEGFPFNIRFESDLRNYSYKESRIEFNGRYFLAREYRRNFIRYRYRQWGDIHKWNHFRKIICVEPSPEKLKNLNKRISNSEIKNRIKIIPNNIQEATLNDHFDIATCFFALNDMTYTDISRMLKNIKSFINKTFIVLFFDYSLFSENIASPSLIYRKCCLRYSHGECDNIMYANIIDSNVTNHYECAINSAKVISIFKENGFELKNQYSIKEFPLLNKYQNKYSSFLKVVEFSNTNNY
ncbi:hypothetical protein BCR36DRAFT_468340 [Piromyces finnis]|uniref:Methyltransferase type 11 domain-containing protein n=1 Tax=Piromyces finnis TaxID=1754191 RepID=A0A1Y1UUV4_9FUNG|nr:hypothetical protein BCR36DRAFT_468340 [Piromyces finnis]|eukprot:ORX41407.1 hypothetical protein BCR36DRAFT_468340 [Piromyces finnis]